MDFDKCLNSQCSLGASCYRRSAPESPNQVWTRFEPYGVKIVMVKTEDPTCFRMTTVPAQCDYHKPIPEQRLDLKGVVR